MSEPIGTSVPPRRPATPPIAVSATTTEVNKTGAWKYIRPVYHDRVAPCNQGCPAGVDVEGYMALLREGKIDEAAELLALEHPMPAVTGRVCNHPCESGCNRGHFDGAVAIHAVERMLGDRLLAAAPPAPAAPTRTERVAVVGSGPAGLACAYHLAAMGYPVDVLEREDRAGGMLRQGIPEYRLPRDVLDAQIRRIEASGVTIHTGVQVTEATLPEIRSRYSVIFFATGAYLGRLLGVEGEELPGVWQGLDFLRRVNAGLRPPLGERVAVIGGGNTAMDCARTALRLGARPIVVYRRTRDEMPAIAEEIEDAWREGVEFVFLAAPTAFRTADGLLSGVACARMKLADAGPDGRRRPVATGESLFVQADTVLLATGEDPELEPWPEEVVRGGAVAIDEWGETASPLVFAGGDVSGDERTVARALGAGKRAAIGIDRALRRRAGVATPDTSALRWGPTGAPSVARWRDADPVLRVAPLNEVVPFEDVNTAHFQLRPRNADRHAALDAAGAPFAEVNGGLGDDVALVEAGRCFNCGVCNECELCLIFCGDVAISHSHDGGRFDIDMNFCKGCGVCAAECPRGAISMTREGL